MNGKSAILCLACFSVSVVAFAQMVAPERTTPHAPMEMLGMGPEMFQDRGEKWVEAIGGVTEKAIAKLGVIALAVILLVQNVKQKASIREVKAHVDERLDRQREDLNAAKQDITAVALSVPPPGPQTVKIEQPQSEPIPVTETPTA